MTVERQTRQQNLDLALIGNSRIAAFIDRRAKIVWWCFPRFNSDPIFSRLLAGDEEKGFCDVALADLVGLQIALSPQHRDRRNDHDRQGGFEGANTDFAPRFERFERMFRPPQIVRRIEPIAGLPRIAIRVRPTHHYGRAIEEVVVGSNHIRYLGGDEVMRLTTDAPLSYITEEIHFPLTRPVNLIFGQDDPFRSAIDATCRQFLDLTREHWLDWVRNLAVPFEWQSEVVRSAITLKLCSFDETGAIVAAHTTSIPEGPSSGRNWDYRFCWLRDAFFVVDALNRLGSTHIMESYLNYITTIATEAAEHAAGAWHCSLCLP